MNSRLLILLLILGLNACGDPPKPKPYGHLRLDLAEVGYTSFFGVCPFTSEIPSDTRFTVRKMEGGSCWFDLAYPSHRAVIHFSYQAVDGRLRALLEDAHALTYEHHIKADRIDSRSINETEAEVFGTMSMLEGAVATNTQFYVTDSTNHFLRGALYFQVAPNPDSLAPVTERIRRDIDHFLVNLQWVD